MSKLDAGLELLSSLNTIDMKTVEIRDMLYYLITKDFSKIDEILASGQKAGLLTNLGQTHIVTQGTSRFKFEKPRIIKQQERANCRFCGKKLTTGYYVVFTARNYGPFGSGCIQKMHMEI